VPLKLEILVDINQKVHFSQKKTSNAYSVLNYLRSLMIKTEELLFVQNADIQLMLMNLRIG